MDNVRAVTGDAADCQLDAREANMLEFAVGDAEPAFDAALTSFAAHHLQTEEKEARMQLALQLFSFHICTN